MDNDYNSFNKNISAYIEKALEKGNEDATYLYNITNELLMKASNYGYGICSCEGKITHSNGGSVRVHTCGFAHDYQPMGKGFFNSLVSAGKQAASTYNANKKVFDFFKNEIEKKAKGINHDKTITTNDYLKVKASGFGWGRSDIGNTDRLVNYAKQGLDYAESIGKIL